MYSAPKILLRSRKYTLQRNCGCEILELVSHDIHNIHEDVFMQTCSSPSKKLFKYSFFLFHLSFQLHLMSLLKHPSSGNYALNNNLSILGFYVSGLKELSCTLHLYYSSNGQSLVVFERVKNLWLSINQLAMKRPWPGGFFLAFSHNTILLT